MTDLCVKASSRRRETSRQHLPAESGAHPGTVHGASQVLFPAPGFELLRISRQLCDSWTLPRRIQELSVTQNYTFLSSIKTEINVLLTLPPPCSCRESPSLFPSYGEHPGVPLPQEVLAVCGPTKPQWNCSEVRSPRGGLLNSESANMEGASLRTSAR